MLENSYSGGTVGNSTGFQKLARERNSFPLVVETDCQVALHLLTTEDRRFHPLGVLMKYWLLTSYYVTELQDSGKKEGFGIAWFSLFESPSLGVLSLFYGDRSSDQESSMHHVVHFDKSIYHDPRPLHSRKSIGHSSTRPHILLFPTSRMDWRYHGLFPWMKYGLLCSRCLVLKHRALTSGGLLPRELGMEVALTKPEDSFLQGFKA
jgi:hypothetical protein